MNRIIRNFLFIFSLICAGTYLFADIPGLIPQPEELGAVSWIRDYDKAISKSEASQKPILILFQEVPGCSTCRGYGNDVLSHPLIVEAIETLFVPLAIHNNKGGKDKQVLESFNEPSWNNPVVRIVDHNRKALVPRINGKYDQYSLVSGMVTALHTARRPVPEYLQLLAEHLAIGATQHRTDKKTKPQEATFGMYCFWTGEAKLGSLPGVVSSEPGFMDGSEVVSVTFNPAIISYAELLKTATDQQAFDRIFVHDQNQQKIASKIVQNQQIKPAKRFRPDHQPKYYLLNTTYRFLPMLPNQASRVNTALRSKANPDKYLSPRQLAAFAYLKKNPDKSRPIVYNAKNYVAKWEDLSQAIN